MNFPAKGVLSTDSFVRILKQASDENLTGMIRIEKAPIVKVVYLQNGTIAFASSNDRADRLTEVFRKAGKLAPEQVEDVIARIKPGVSLGKTLIELGYITPRDLLWGARAQVEQIIFNLLTWQEGEYQVVVGNLPKEIITLNLSVPQTIFSGTTDATDREWILGFIGSPETVYEHSPEFSTKQSAYHLPLPEAVSRMDGRTPLNEIAEKSGADSFEICKTAAALQLLGMIRPVDVTTHSPQDEVTSTPFWLQQEESEPFEAPREQVDDSDTVSFPPLTNSGPTLITPSPFRIEARDAIELDEDEEEEEEQQRQEQEEKDDDERGSQAQDQQQREIPVPMQIFPAQESYVPDEPPVPEASMPTAQRETSLKRPWMLGLLLLLGVAVLAFAFYWLRDTENNSAATDTPLIRPNTAASKPQEEKHEATTPKPVEIQQQQGTEQPVTEETLPQIATRWSRQLEANRNGYSLQLMTACKPKTIRDIINVFPERQAVGLLPIRLNQQNCYRIFYGIFSSPDQATAAQATLPEAVRNQTKASPPTILPISKLVQ